MKNKYFVFDTNVLVSALILPRSVSRLSLIKADDAGILIFSNETLAELTDVLIRSKFDRYVSLKDRLEYIERVETRNLVMETSSVFTDCRDIKDNKFLNVAVDARVLCIVSGDKDLLTLTRFRNIAILSPFDLLNNFDL